MFDVFLWQALVLEAEEAARDSAISDTNFYEVTIASVDQPKLLSRLSEALVRQRFSLPFQISR